MLHVILEWILDWKYTTGVTRRIKEIWIWTVY